MEYDDYRFVSDEGEPILVPVKLFDAVDDQVPAEWIRQDTEDDFYLGPAELAARGFFERWHDRETEARRVFAQVYTRLWVHYESRMERQRMVLKSLPSAEKHG